MSMSTIQNLDEYYEFCRGGLDDPYPFYNRLRSEDPVHWSEILNGWVLTRYEDVVFGLRDSRLSAKRTPLWMQSVPSHQQEEMKPLRDGLQKWLIHLDPPEHTRMRKLVNKAFTPKAVEAMRSRIQAVVNELLDQVQPRGEMELIEDIAYKLPATVISDILGVPREDSDQFRSWSQDIMAFAGATSLTIPDRGTQANRSLKALSHYFLGLIEKLRRNPVSAKVPDDRLLSALIAVEEDGDVLTDDELIAFANMLFVAGHETTMNLIGNGVLVLLQHPDQRRMLMEDPDLIASTVEEILRYERPVKRQTRVALEDLEIGGKSVRKGQFVMNMLSAANHDPAQFTDPDRLDISRSENKHVAFGTGIHFCLGAFLARVEGQIAIDGIFRRLPSIRLADVNLQWQENMSIRGITALPVVF